MRRALRAALALATLAAAVLGWGAWRAWNHADLTVAVNDVALKSANQLWGAVASGRIVLRDAKGQALAQAEITAPYVVQFSDPAAGACERFERAAALDALAREQWDRCYQQRARWQATWARKVVGASVETGRCVIDHAPVTTRRYDDWWLWWVPLPHVGGSASAHYAFEIFIDSAACMAATAP